MYLLNPSLNRVTIFWGQAQNALLLSAWTQDRAMFTQVLQNTLDFKILPNEDMWPYFGKNPFSPSFPQKTKLLITMDYLFKSELFHCVSEQVLRPAESYTFIWETKWPIFYIFVCKKSAAQSLVPYRFMQASDFSFVWLVLFGFFGFYGMSTITTITRIITTNNYHIPTTHLLEKSPRNSWTLSNINKKHHKEKECLFLFILEN